MPFPTFIWSKLMHGHHHNLEKLYQKLQFRYGDDDDLVLQLKHELESLDSLEAKAKSIAMKSHGRSGRDEKESLKPLH
jgi:hypothetical protein